MMFKIGKGLKHPALVSKFLHGHQVLNLTEGHHQLNTLLRASILEDSKIAKFLEYLEAGLSGSMRNPNLINSDLSVSDPLTLSIFFTLETIGMEGGSRAQKDSIHWSILKTYSWPLSSLKFFNRSVITVLYVEKKIAIHGYHLF
jgi:hypothetical protein